MPSSPTTSREATDSWEQAYEQYETRPERITRYRRRLVRLGLGRNDVASRVLDLFSGSGENHQALAETGLDPKRIVSADLSRALVSKTPRGGVCADARRLPFADDSFDIVVVQGGLHHLPTVHDLEATFDDIHRVLRPSGRFLFCEPLGTRTLTCVLSLIMSPLGRLHAKTRAVRQMVHLEGRTYRTWLASWPRNRQLLASRFKIISEATSWNSVAVVCRPT